MKKTEFIKRYGLEAYERHLAKKREYNKEYYRTNKEDILEHQKQYKQQNVDAIRQYNKQYYQQNVEYFKDKNKEYYQQNADNLKQYQQQYYQQNTEARKLYNEQYYQDNADYFKHYNKQYRQTPMGKAVYLAENYKRNDDKYNRQNNITAEWIVDNIFNSKCVYCGESDWKKLGCDRKVNSIGHITTNVVCSCWDCNNERKTASFGKFYRKKVNAVEIERPDMHQWLVENGYAKKEDMARTA